MTIHGRIVGLAHGRGELAEFLRTGLGAQDDVIDLADADVVEWRGGGMDVWPRR